MNFRSFRNFPEESPNVINWSHIDGLFDVILTIGKQTLIETDEKVVRCHLNLKGRHI